MTCDEMSAHDNKEFLLHLAGLVANSIMQKHASNRHYLVENLTDAVRENLAHRSIEEMMLVEEAEALRMPS